MYENIFKTLKDRPSGPSVGLKALTEVGLEQEAAVFNKNITLIQDMASNRFPVYTETNFCYPGICIKYSWFYLTCTCNLQSMLLLVNV